MSSDAIASSSLAVKESAGLTGDARSCFLQCERTIEKKFIFNDILSTCGEIHGTTQINIHARGSFMNYVDCITISCDC